MTENLTQVVESRLRTQSFSETNGATVEKNRGEGLSRELYLQSEVKPAATESHELQFLNKFDEASNTVKSSFL